MVDTLVDCYGNIRTGLRNSNVQYPVIRNENKRLNEYRKFISILNVFTETDIITKDFSPEKTMIITRDYCMDEIVFLSKQSIDSTNDIIRKAFGDYKPTNEKENLILKSIFRTQENNMFKYYFIQAEKIEIERNIFDGNIISIEFKHDKSVPFISFVKQMEKYKISNTPKDYVHLFDNNENEINLSELSKENILSLSVAKNKNDYETDSFLTHFYNCVCSAEKEAGLNERDCYSNKKNMNIIFTEDYKYTGKMFPIYTQFKERISKIDFLTVPTYKGNTLKCNANILGIIVPVVINVCGDYSTADNPVFLCNGEIFSSLNDLCNCFERKCLSLLYEPSWMTELKKHMPNYQYEDIKQQSTFIQRPKKRIGA